MMNGCDDFTAMVQPNIDGSLGGSPGNFHRTVRPGRVVRADRRESHDDARDSMGDCGHGRRALDRLAISGRQMVAAGHVGLST